jgi:hypothetical protein
MGSPAKQSFENFRTHRASTVGKVADIDIQQSYSKEVTVLSWATTNKNGHSSLLLRNHLMKNAHHIEQALKDDLLNYRYVSFAGMENGDGRFLSSYFEDMEMMCSRNTRVKLNNKAINPPYDFQKIYRVEPNIRGTEIHNESFYSEMVNSGIINEVDGYLESWGNLARDFVSLPSFDLDHIGLNTPRIVEWCHLHHASEKFKYKEISRENNCSSVAWRALVAGGGLAFCKVGGNNPPSHYIYITPKDLKNFADYIKTGILKVQKSYTNVKRKVYRVLRDQFANLTIISKAKTGFEIAKKDSAELYSYNEWKAETKGNFLGFRGKCADFDDNIKEYSKYQWDPVDHMCREDQYSKKFLILLQILNRLDQCWAINENYCKLEQPALVALSAQVCRVIDKRLRPDALKDWGTLSYYLKDDKKKDSS